MLPTGTDDTANIQCAFNHAAREHGSTVQLFAATYHTGQVAVIGFVGSFRGAGMKHTIIETLNRPLDVAPLDFLKKLPTPETGSNPWPSIFAFVGGDLTVSDLTPKMSPNTWTTGWTWTGLGITVYELAHGFVIVGPVVPGRPYTEANAALIRAAVQGVANEGTLLAITQSMLHISRDFWELLTAARCASRASSRFTTPTFGMSGEARTCTTSLIRMFPSLATLSLTLSKGWISAAPS